MFPTGIDWSEKHLDFCITNDSGDVINRDRVDNNDDGFNALLQSFEKEQIDLSEIAVAIESPHQRIVDFLLARGVNVYPVNPTAVHDYRKSRFPSGISYLLTPSCLLTIFASTIRILEFGALKNQSYAN